MLYSSCSRKWFTLIEILVWIVIFSIIVVIWFNAYFSVLIWKGKLIEKTTIEKNAFYFSEKIFEMIKKWWVIDYEEYFNRKVKGNSTYLSGHYSTYTWFWNYWNNIAWVPPYWNWYYYCRSWNWTANRVWTWGCYSNSLNSMWTNFIWESQRYWQYYLQFMDYNYDYNWDVWDHDWDWNFKWDDDDEFLWEGPTVFAWWTDVKELYLISWDKKTRTYFRWNVKQDINHPTNPTTSCTFGTGQSPTGSWCLWTIEFLKLDWKDWWLDHSSGTIDSSQYDWLMDTWLINPNFTTTSNEVAELSNTNNYWVPLFPDTINVKDFRLFVYPNKDRENSWKNTGIDVNISPYVKIQMTLTPSWAKRIWMKWKIPEIPLNMTISLTDIFTK